MPEALIDLLPAALLLLVLWRIQPARPVADTLLVIEMEGGGKPFRRAEKDIVIKREIRHGNPPDRLQFRILNGYLFQLPVPRVNSKESARSPFT